ncbi:U3 small nucleolar RNA-associated protein 11 [Trichocladium antarcticum]|uniref:U3 small nucleolar RNA-associated protein 11 n=1 Tax=Trichocladium antarcticum TaxID=1450529 RepID=A0AAN6UGU3_9PEZI|nr:U3 small nucleolar RNA-associated protein 11 [Trichocladium antarcticum]
MSSLRNSVQRRSHRERAQPLERAKLGLLEKKKDYQKRAKDYNKKKAVLKSLREKAADRNEDEFYFGMMSRKGPGARIKAGKSFTGTVEGDRGNKAMDVDAVRLLKTQDLGYIRTMRNVAAKEVRGLEERWVLAGGTEMDDDEDDDSDDDDDEMRKPAARPQNAKRIVFFDAADEREQVLHKQAEDDDTAMGEGGDDDGKKEAEARRKEQNLEKLERRLRAAKKKLKALRDAEYELELQQAKMAKTATSGGITKSGRKIKVRERKR